LKGLIVQATGAEANSAAVQKTLSTFNALKKRADFSVAEKENDIDSAEVVFDVAASNHMPIHSSGTTTDTGSKEGINLSYTINLNLPPTKDIEVFNAIFKSLKQHLLKD
jgi:hypothetical protein